MLTYGGTRLPARTHNLWPLPTCLPTCLRACLRACVALRSDFLARPRDAVEAQVAASVALLSAELPGADLAGMLEHDPGLLFLDLRPGTGLCMDVGHGCMTWVFVWGAWRMGCSVNHSVSGSKATMQHACMRAALLGIANLPISPAACVAQAGALPTRRC